MADYDMKDDSIPVATSPSSTTPAPSTAPSTVPNTAPSTATSGSLSNGRVAQTTVAMLQGTQPVSRDGSGTSHSSNREIEMAPLSPIEEQSAERTSNVEIEVVLPSQLDGVNTVRIR